MPIVNRVADLHADITEWRRDLHMHPELQYDVHRTAGSVAEKLKAFGCDEVVTGLGRTGVVGVIRGKKGVSGKTIGLRADMDALPIEEASDLPYKSTVPGKMHACGHDGHTAMLLGAARYLAETRNFSGTAVVIFQPAEEGGGGGKAMVNDGLMIYPLSVHFYLAILPTGGAPASRRRHGSRWCADHQRASIGRVAQRRPAQVGGRFDLHVSCRQYR